jgi:ubiquinone/menaquinone biosynthesis C-methylase UbiE
MIDEQNMLKVNKEGWDIVANQFFEGSFDDLQYGVYGPKESELNMLGSIEGKTILEVGCGSGHTLEYFSKKNAKELFGVDISSTQIETAKKTNSKYSTPITFIESPMEEMDFLPKEYFDIAISVYALGWTVNLAKTLTKIHNSLKPGGIFVFSWEHPIHSLLEYQDGKLYFRLSYVSEVCERHESWRKVPIYMNYRKLSTYLNELIRTGFVIDQVVEETRVPVNDESKPEKWYSAAKAEIIPPSIIIKCHKE